MGLAGKLIFDVMEAIRHSHRGIKTFCTLSPIPGFWRRYVKPILEGQFTSFKMTTDKFISRFSQKTRKSLTERYTANTGENAPEFASTLLRILATPGWIEDSVYADLLCRPLTELTHFYIKQEKDLSGKPLNAVANFHMRNGASAGFENINYGANRSERGLQDSCGMMVNYMYSETWFGRFYRKRGVRR